MPSSATYRVRTTTSGDPTEGRYALELASSSMTVARCGVVHGPAVYSSEVQAAAGDKIYFDWRAFAGDDAYAVFGYIVDRDGNQTEVLDAWTSNAAGTTQWTTKETVIPESGWYRFVFVAGTYDATCGTAAGARLLIDNVKVYGTKASDEVASQVAQSSPTGWTRRWPELGSTRVPSCWRPPSAPRSAPTTTRRCPSSCAA